MISIDTDETSELVLVHDAVGSRVVITMGHPDGIVLLQKLQDYYGSMELSFPENVQKETTQKQGLVERLLKRFTHGG
jgi:hypothetical protein